MFAASARPGEAFTWITAINESMKEDTIADSNSPCQYSMGFEALGATLSSALSLSVLGEFSWKVQRLKMEALDCGRRASGRRMSFTIDQHFNLTETDGAGFRMEHLLAVAMRGDTLEQFASGWDTVITGMKKMPEDPVLDAIFMGHVRFRPQMKDDAHDYV